MPKFQSVYISEPKHNLKSVFLSLCVWNWCS